MSDFFRAMPYIFIVVLFFLPFVLLGIGITRMFEKKQPQQVGVSVQSISKKRAWTIVIAGLILLLLLSI
jgi:hypothetical protein